MAKEVVASTNWEECIALGVNKKAQKTISDKSIAPSNIQDIIPSACLDQSFYMERNPPPLKLENVNISHCKERGFIKQPMNSSNLYTSPLHTYSLPFKNKDYVWLDPNGCLVSPPGNDEHGLDGGLTAGSVESSVPSINISFSNNIRKVKQIYLHHTYSLNFDRFILTKMFS